MIKLSFFLIFTSQVFASGMYNPTSSETQDSHQRKMKKGMMKNKKSARNFMCKNESLYECHSRYKIEKKNRR